VASLDGRYRGQGLRVIGLHAPEFEHEHDTSNVRRQVKELEIPYPVVIDNGFRMWEALGNRYWPAFYLAGRDGGIRHVHVGETHEGSASARGFERVLERLLAESP
jgi:hypothetical protein